MTLPTSLDNEEWQHWVDAHVRIVICAINHRHGSIVKRQILAHDLKAHVEIATSVSQLYGLRNDGVVGVIVVASTSWPWDLVEYLNAHGFHEGDEHTKLWYT